MWTTGTDGLRLTRRERVWPWVLIAGTLAVAGAAATIWRPSAPSLAPVVTDVDQFDPAVLAAIESYRSPRAVVAVLVTTLNVAVPVLFVLTPRGRRWVARVAGPAARSPLRAAAVALAVAVASSLVTLPLSAWTRLVHDGRWGFRTQPATGWLRDWLVVSSGTWLAVVVLVALLFVAIPRWPRSWPYRLTVVGGGLAAVVVLVHPIVLQPILLPIRPFPDGPHRVAIEEVLEAAGNPDLTLVVGEASRRSTRVNAQVTGLGPTARVVVHDNLLELPPPEVASVLAHELAHHEHRDLLRGTLLVPTALLPGLLLLRRVLAAPAVRRGVGARGAADPRLAAVVLAAVAVAELAVQPVTNLVSRQLEAAADARAVEISGDAGTLIAATRVFAVRDLSTPEPAGWVTFLYRTHPSVGERIRQAAAIADRDDLEVPTRDEFEAREREQRHDAIGQARP